MTRLMLLFLVCLAWPVGARADGFDLFLGDNQADQIRQNDKKAGPLGLASEQAAPKPAQGTVPRTSPPDAAPAPANAMADAATGARTLPSDASQESAESQDYHIGANDLLEISVFQIAELSRTVRVNSRGMISLPLIGLVKAGGLTGQDLEQLIAKKLTDGYLQDPQVSVFIKEYTSQKVTIEGSVEKAGVYPLTGRTTLLQAIAQAAGPNDVANYNAIKLIRARQDGTREMTLHDLEAIRDGKAIDPVLVGNDIIVVDKSTGRSVIKDVTNTLRGFFSFGTLQ
jgi:polysaccharide export outer membrane protein